MGRFPPGLAYAQFRRHTCMRVGLDYASPRAIWRIRSAENMQSHAASQSCICGNSASANYGRVDVGAEGASISVALARTLSAADRRYALWQQARRSHRESRRASSVCACVRALHGAHRQVITFTIPIIAATTCASAGAGDTDVQTCCTNACTSASSSGACLSGNARRSGTRLPLRAGRAHSHVIFPTARKCASDSCGVASKKLLRRRLSAVHHTAGAAALLGSAARW